jgi:hypothetical protein
LTGQAPAVGEPQVSLRLNAAESGQDKNRERRKIAGKARASDGFVGLKATAPPAGDYGESAS